MLMFMAIEDVELRHLRALRAVAEEGSFIGAADLLGFSQAAISQQIAGLERAIGQSVFDRPGGPRRVTLTPAERQAIERRPTSNLNAFLQYSRGLQATDDGRFEDAARFFNDARSLDPGFSIAAVRAQSTQAAAQAAVQSVEVAAVAIESNLKTTTEGAAVTAAMTGNPTAGSAGTSSGSNTHR